MKQVKLFLLTVLIVVFCSCLNAAEKPNVIVILVDDMGWMDLSCQGSDYYKTPAIDSIAEGGMRFTNGYAACAVCSPTRAAVQTGRYPHRVGLTDYIRHRFYIGRRPLKENPTKYTGGRNQKVLCPPNPYWMEHEEITIAEALKEAGYKSGYIGKWHLGDPDWYPEGQGYDVNRGGCFYGQPPSYFDPYNKPKSKHESLRNGIYNLPPRKPGEYLTYREADEAETLIRKWHAEKQPFFLHVSHYAVHTPIQAIEEVAAKYKRKGKNDTNAKYAAMVESVDDSTEQILSTVKELGIEKNTIVIFTSDNGGLDTKGRPTDNAPLRSGKGFPYEGGIRVPFMVRWPGVIPEGKISDQPVCSIDIFPTILEAVGVKLPEGRAIDGLSFLDHFKSGGKSDIDRDELLWHFPHYRYGSRPYSIIRKGDLKLIKYWTGGYELFDLSTDLSEENNLADKMPEKVKQLDAVLMKRLAAGNAKLPRKNPAYVPKEKNK